MKEHGLEGLYQDRKISVIKSMVEQKKFGQALAEIREEEALGRFAEDSSQQGEFYYISALIFYHTGRYQEAKERASRAYQIFRPTAANQILGEIQYISGAIHQALGDFEEA